MKFFFLKTAGNDKSITKERKKRFVQQKKVDDTRQKNNKKKDQILLQKGHMGQRISNLHVVSPFKKFTVRAAVSL